MEEELIAQRRKSYSNAREPTFELKNFGCLQQLKKGLIDFLDSDPSAPAEHRRQGRRFMTRLGVDKAMSSGRDRDELISSTIKVSTYFHQRFIAMHHFRPTRIG
jgi:hypothetical protein